MFERQQLPSAVRGISLRHAIGAVGSHVVWHHAFNGSTPICVTLSGTHNLAAPHVREHSDVCSHAGMVGICCIVRNRSDAAHNLPVQLPRWRRLLRRQQLVPHCRQDYLQTEMIRTDQHRRFPLGRASQLHIRSSRGCSSSRRSSSSSGGGGSSSGGAGGDCGGSSSSPTVGSGVASGHQCTAAMCIK